VDVLVNRAHDAGEAGETFARLRIATERFLGLDIHSAGWLPECESWRLASRAPGRLLDLPSDAVAQLARTLAPTIAAEDPMKESASWRE
jgi:MinD-like ATPase involved in chromosome partitioning or flagellar assembly